jgi:hypothetical protein
LSGVLGPDHHLLSELQHLSKRQTREDLPVLQQAVCQACRRKSLPLKIGDRLQIAQQNMPRTTLYFFEEE